MSFSGSTTSYEDLQYPRGFPETEENFVKLWQDCDELTQRLLIQTSLELDLVLLRLQWLQVLRQLGILSRNTFVFNTSQTGAGKTYIEVFMAKYFSLLAKHLGKEFLFCVVCPLNAQPVWLELCGENNMMPDFIESYDSFARVDTRNTVVGPGGVVANHGYAGIVDIIATPKKKKTVATDDVVRVYRPTIKWCQFVADNVAYVVCDECQKLKNRDTAMNRSVSALARPIVGMSDHYSRVSFASATPLDAEEAFVAFFQVIGAMFVNTALFDEQDNFHGAFREAGIAEIKNYCRDIDPDLLDSLEPVAPGNYMPFVSKLFLHCIIKNYFHGIPAEIDRDMYDVYNGYYSLGEAKLALFSAKLRELSEAMYGRKEDGAFSTGGGRKGNNMGKYAKILEELQAMKLPLFMQEGVKVLRSNPNSKLVISVNHLQHKNDLATFFERELGGRRVLQIHGSMKAAERKSAVKAFEEPNTEYRVLILIAASGGVALSLHDKHGGFPRTLLVMPSYNMMHMVQVAGRIIRTGMKSRANVINIWVNDKGLEMRNQQNSGDVRGFKVRDSFNPSIEGYCQEYSLSQALMKRGSTARQALMNNVDLENDEAAPVKPKSTDEKLSEKDQGKGQVKISELEVLNTNAEEMTKMRSNGIILPDQYLTIVNVD